MVDCVQAEAELAEMLSHTAAPQQLLAAIQRYKAGGAAICGGVS